MIKLYTTPSCTSCRKAKLWLDAHELEYEEVNFFKTPITKNELRQILMNTENGTSDVISVRSKIYKKLAIDFDSLSFNEFLDVITENPGLLRRPIMIEESKMMIGYNEDEIRCFVPRDYRETIFKYRTTQLAIEEYA